MTTASSRTTRTTLLLVLLSWGLVRLLFWLVPSVFEPWNARCVDLLFQWRNASDSLRPYYDDTVVHVDLNLSSMQQIEGFYLDRSHFARSVRNLAAMNMAAQVYDFIFAARSDSAADRALIDAATSAGNVYLGSALELSGGQSGDRQEARAPADAVWDIEAKQTEHFSISVRSLDTFPELAAATRGMGHLNTVTDADGVYRRLPLLIRSGTGFVPSLAFRAVCDYLQVTPDRIRVHPGQAIVLQEAKRSDATTRDIVIPIDDQGNMIINFVGPWERMTHYNFADVLGRPTIATNWNSGVRSCRERSRWSPRSPSAHPTSVRYPRTCSFHSAACTPTPSTPS